MKGRAPRLRIEGARLQVANHSSDRRTHGHCPAQDRDPPAPRREDAPEATSGRVRSDAGAASAAADLQLTANLIHELRTPLNAIIGFADVLQNEVFGELPHPKCREYVGDILESSRHLLALVNEILDLSRADAGRLELSEAVVDIATTIRSCTKMIAPSAG